MRSKILNQYRTEFMRTDSDVNKIWGNITPPNDKTRTILATMHKGVAANGMAIVLSLFEV